MQIASSENSVQLQLNINAYAISKIPQSLVPFVAYAFYFILEKLGPM